MVSFHVSTPTLRVTSEPFPSATRASSTTGTVRRALMILATCASAPSCQEAEVREFEHTIEIGDQVLVSSDSALCQEDILRIERAIEHAQDVLGTSVDEPIRMYLYDRGLSRCIAGASGCVVDGEIHTLWESIDHELVHAVAGPLGRPSSFWAEGIAEALSDRTQRGSTDVGINLDLTPGDLDYHTAGHFVRWLLEGHGEEGIRQIARGESFSSSYGFELSDAIADYETEAPWSYPRWNPCPGEELVPMETDHWESTIDATCSKRGSTGDGTIGTGAIRTITIQNPGTYRLMLRGGTEVKVLYCQTSVLEVEPAGEFAGDIRREDAGLKPPSTFISGEEYLVQFEAGMHEFRFNTAEGDGEQLQLDLAPM